LRPLLLSNSICFSQYTHPVAADKKQNFDFISPIIGLYQLRTKTDSVVGVSPTKEYFTGRPSVRIMTSKIFTKIYESVYARIFFLIGCVKSLS
jgi:hypothetical protein